MSEGSISKFRRWLNQYAWVVTMASVIVLILCLYFLPPDPPPFLDSFFPHHEVKTYFYDLSNDQLFAADIKALPPIPAPSGNKTPDGRDTGVRAIVFSCGDCTDEKQRYIGYLETLTPEAKETIISRMNYANGESSTAPATQDMQDPMMYGRMIMDPQIGDWITMDSPDAGKLILDSMKKCGAGR
jgi:hypothetical protein